MKVASRTFEQPSDCPCCGAECDGELEIPLDQRQAAAPSSARVQRFPYCRRCIAHVAAVDRTRVIAATILLAGIAIAGVVALVDEPLHGVLVVGATIALVMLVGGSLLARAQRRCSEGCASSERAVAYLGWNGSASSFRFASAVYTARFAEANTDQLVEVSEPLAHLLRAHARVRVEVPTPAAPMRAVAPNTRAAWLAELTAQAGPLGRRRVLSRALAVTYDPDERAALISVVAHAELDAELVALDGLPPASRRRRVRQLIEVVAADNLHDELREVMLAVLRAVER